MKKFLYNTKQLILRYWWVCLILAIVGYVSMLFFPIDGIGTTYSSWVFAVFADYSDAAYVPTSTYVLGSFHFIGFVSICLATIFAIITKGKTIWSLSICFIPLAIASCVYMNELNEIANVSILLKDAPYWATIMITLFACIAVVLAVITLLPNKWLTSSNQRTPRPHKPTKAERIAELEKQVSELQNDKSTD